MSKQTLRERAEQWIKDNPEGFALFERFALRLADAGKNFGINLIRERVRWETTIEQGQEEFKFTNSFSPYVARELIRRHPRLALHMETRATKDEAKSTGGKRTRKAGLSDAAIDETCPTTPGDLSGVLRRSPPIGLVDRRQPIADLRGAPIATVIHQAPPVTSTAGPLEGVVCHNGPVPLLPIMA